MISSGLGAFINKEIDFFKILNLLTKADHLRKFPLKTSSQYLSPKSLMWNSKALVDLNQKDRVKNRIYQLINITLLWSTPCNSILKR